MFDLLLSFDPILVIILIITGFAIGTIAAMVGIGGGLLLVPFLILFFSLSPQEASTVSLFVMMFTSSSGSYTYYKQKWIDLRTGLLFAACVVPTSFLGSWIAKEIDPTVLIVIFGLLLLGVSSRRIFNLITNNKSTSTVMSKNTKDPSIVKEEYS